MNEQRTSFERGLNDCAERGVPDGLDLWESIEAQATALPVRSQRVLWSGRSRIIWAVLILMVSLLGTSAYAATEIFDIGNRVERIFLAETPGAEQEGLSVPLDLRQSKDGVDVALVRVYADSDNVVIGFSTNSSDGHGSQTVTIPKASLTDEDGTKFRITEGSSQSFSAETPGISNVVFFESRTKLPPDGNRRFSLEVDVENGRSGAIIPFTFDFEVPVLPISTTVLDLDQEVRSNGLTLTLDQVEFSPVVNRAVVCPDFDSSKGKSDWLPVVSSGRLGEVGSPATDLSIAPDGCATMNLSSPLYGDPGSHRLTVREIRRGMSQENPQGRRTYGPWTFDFDVPEP